MSEVKPKKIVVIEDEQTLSEILVTKLNSQGYVVSSASDGGEGLELMRRENPDLVLLDMMLPSMTGYQVLEAMRADNVLRYTKVIIISNSGQPVEIERALELGVKDYLIKAQFDPNEVMQKVHTQLQDKENTTREASILDKKKILIVEDDKFLRDLVTQKFKKLGLEPLVAVDGEQGLHLAEREKPDLILLDILLPGMDGFTVLQKIRENPEIAKTAIIVLSNFGQKEDIARAQKLGADLYLVKASITLDEVVEKVKMLLTKTSIH